MKKKVLYIVFALFILLQLIPSELPIVTNNNPNDLIVNNKDIPDNIINLLRNSCYDCHSNETNYPWYSKLSPVSLLVARDTKEGRLELNFSNWESLSSYKKAGVLSDISDAIVLGEMPMQIYTAIHWSASLSEDEKKELINWANNYSEQLFE